MLTRPRGSRNVTFESLDRALNDRNVSAKVSALDFPKLGSRAVWAPFFEVGAAAVAGLNRPVHNFGVVQAFGGGEAILASSFSSSAELAFLLPSCSVGGVEVCCGFGLSSAFSDTGFGESFGVDLGIAGIKGTAGTVDRWDGFGTMGVVSPGTGSVECCIEDGVVGFVDSACSDVAWLVKGVSGRCAAVSDGTGCVASALGACWMIGSSTGSADRWACGFLFRRGFLAGQGRSGCDNHGSCLCKQEVQK